MILFRYLLIGCSVMLACLACALLVMLLPAAVAPQALLEPARATAMAPALVRADRELLPTPTLIVLPRTVQLVSATPTATATLSSTRRTFACPGGCITQPDPSCNIKGNVNNRGERIYHQPGGRFYEKTQIRPEEGDRWFCTRQEAEEAGFRPSKR